MSDRRFWGLIGKTTCIAIVVGKPQTGNKIPALYLYGEIVGMGEGIFRSLDRGKTCVNIAFLNQPIGNEPNVMEAHWQ